METIEQPLERPKTSRSRRPPSRGGRHFERFIDDESEESNGRPGSRRGFTPETYEREDYDEFSRQNHGVERLQLTPEYGNISPHQQRSSPAFRENPYLQKTYRPHRDSPLIQNPSPHYEQAYERPSSRRRETPDSERRYQSNSPRHSISDQQYGRRKSSSSGHSYLDPHLINQHYGNHQGDQNSYSQNTEFENRTNSPEMETNVLCMEDSWPVVPREKPPTARPKSSKKRLKSGRRRRQSQDAQEQACPAVDTQILRPPSSLSKYKPLPAIGAVSSPTESMDQISAQTQNITLGLGERTRTSYSIDLHKSDKKSENSENNNQRSEQILMHQEPQRKQSDAYSEHSYRQDQQHTDLQNSFIPHQLPAEPDESEDRVLLAIRLPDGRRHQRFFRNVESMDLVLKFAENVSYMNLSEHRLACNAPRAVFSDLSLLVGDSGLQDRTILYLEEID